MMCLGKNWDPEVRSYVNHRSIDGALAPSIPGEFKQLVEEALEVSHAFIKQELKNTNVETILPGMHPDICIVNFYTHSGKLGLHQVCSVFLLFYSYLKALHYLRLFLLSLSMREKAKCQGGET